MRLLCRDGRGVRSAMARKLAEVRGERVRQAAVCGAAGLHVPPGQHQTDPPRHRLRLDCAGSAGAQGENDQKWMQGGTLQRGRTAKRGWRAVPNERKSVNRSETVLTNMKMTWVAARVGHTKTPKPLYQVFLN